VDTEQLCAVANARRRPSVLVSGSAVGYYGNRGDEILREDAAPADDFLARLCRDWEAAAERARGLGLRVVTLRTGVVLGCDGGALAMMLPPFKLGLGGPIGSGRQYVPWIHIRDFVQIVATALVDARYSARSTPSRRNRSPAGSSQRRLAASSAALPCCRCRPRPYGLFLAMRRRSCSTVNAANLQCFADCIFSTHFPPRLKPSPTSRAERV
jgi:hypothetical protein